MTKKKLVQQLVTLAENKYCTKKDDYVQER